MRKTVIKSGRRFAFLFGSERSKGRKVGTLIIQLGLALLYLVCCLPPSEAAQRIVCSDGEAFYLNEVESVETVNFATVNTDLIIVEKRYCRLTLYRDDQVLKKYSVAIGKSQTPTPVGEWKIIHKGGNWGGGFGSRWLGLNVPWGIYGIHGTDKPGSIGWMSSHGCIRMYNRNIVELYNLVQVGTPVRIIGDLPPVKLGCSYQLKAVGKGVLRLQFALRRQGFDPGTADARFGPAVEEAVHKMQLYYGLNPTGTIASNELFLLDLR
jgi:hypothetical protein